MEEHKGYVSMPLNIEIEAFKFLHLRAQEEKITIPAKIRAIIEYYIDLYEHDLL
jgi:hypothetical protein